MEIEILISIFLTCLIIANIWKVAKDITAFNIWLITASTILIYIFWNFYNK